MNKTQLVERVAETLGIPVTRAGEPVEAVLDVIVRELAAGGFVRLTGFGVLDTKVTAARKRRNPQTGEPVAVPATVRVRFRPGQGLLALLNGGRKLPASGSAVAKAPKGSLSGGAR